MSTGPAPRTRGPHLGTVTDFDPDRGLGTVTDDDGRPYGFHATAIADGTRRVAVGTAVTFTLRPGARGAYEADGLTPTGRAGGPGM